MQRCSQHFSSRMCPYTAVWWRVSSGTVCLLSCVMAPGQPMLFHLSGGRLVPDNEGVLRSIPGLQL